MVQKQVGGVVGGVQWSTVQVSGLPHNETSPNNSSQARSAIVTSSRESITPVVLTMSSKPEADPMGLPPVLLTAVMLCGWVVGPGRTHLLRHPASRRWR